MKIELQAFLVAKQYPFCLRSPQKNRNHRYKKMSQKPRPNLTLSGAQISPKIVIGKSDPAEHSPSKCFL